jgi:hypothetical protein
MCHDMHIEPDVHSLFDWSQYLAPAIAKVRYDTIFYLVTLPNIYPCAIADNDDETVSADVCSYFDFSFDIQQLRT